MSKPSLSNSPWMRGPPQSGFASAMVRTSSAISEPTRGRPTRPRGDFQVQKARKPCRCQRMTVSGRTRWSAWPHPDHRLESHNQKARSRRPNRGRFDRRRSRASCCRSARFSSARSARVLSAARRRSTERVRGTLRSMARTPLTHRPVLKKFGKRQVRTLCSAPLQGPVSENISEPGPSCSGGPHRLGTKTEHPDGRRDSRGMRAGNPGPPPKRAPPYGATPRRHPARRWA